MILSLTPAKLEQWSAFADSAPSPEPQGSVNRTLPPKPEPQAWLYGTARWDALRPEQRMEMLWLEHAHTISALIWFREGLTPLYTRLMTKYGERIAPEVRAYMNAFCAKEAEHTRVLRRYLDEAGLPLYERPDLIDLIPMIERVHPIAGILCTFLIEGSIAEMLRDAEGLDPYTRALCVRQQRDDARHLAFSRALCDSMLEDSSPATKARVSHLTRGYMGHAIRRFSYHPEIARYLSFDLALDAGDEETLEVVRRSENSRGLNRERFGALLEWVRGLGIVKPAYDWSNLDEGILPLAHFGRWSQNGPFSAVGRARKARAAAAQEAARV